MTFGSLNNFGKNSPEAMATWIELLKRAPESRLVLQAYPFSHRQRLWDLLKLHGVEPGRLKFIETVATEQNGTERSAFEKMISGC